MHYSADKTAILLIGFQNDFLDKKGALSAVIEQNVSENKVIEHATFLIEQLKDTDILIVNTPILFSEDYSELHDPSGLMATIKDAGAFRRDAWGGEVHPAILAFGDRILHLRGKTRFNGFHGTDLHGFLAEKGIEHIVIAGVITSLCVDSTARAASDLGFSVTILTDCSAARSMDEHSFYCESIFPLYASTETAESFVSKVEAGAFA